MYRVFDQNVLDSQNLSNRDLRQTEFLPGLRFRGVSFRNSNLEGVSFRGQQLAGADFRGCNLANAIFEDAHLTDALFDGATFYWTRFNGMTKFGPVRPIRYPQWICYGRKKTLVGVVSLVAHLYGLDFTETNFEFANFSKGNFAKTNLTNTRFRFANLSYCDFERAWMVGTDFHGAKLVGSNFRRTDMSRICLDGLNLEGVLYDEATLWPAEFDPNDSGTLFIGPGANLRGADLSKASLIDANLNGADLSEANLSHTTLIGADLRNARVEGAYFYEAGFGDSTQWPEGFDPIMAGAINFSSH